jgi:bacillolysin
MPDVGKGGLMRRGWGRAVVLATAFAAATSGLSRSLHGQRPQSVAPSASATVGSPGALAGWAGRADAMLRDGQLDIGPVQQDTMLPGRLHERLVQRYQGLPVFGGQLVRQMNGDQIVSVFGRIFDGVSVPEIEPALDGAAAGAAAERDLGSGAVAGRTELGVLPRTSGAVLVYRIDVRSGLDVQVYYVNARTGAIEEHRSRILHQSPVVTAGSGVLNDPKKVSAQSTSSGYRAVDSLRPADAFTLDFHGSFTRLNSFLQSGTVVTADLAVSSTPTWTDGAVVDAHVYEGWVYDYYYRRFGRRGLDDHDIPVVGIVHPLARADASQYAPETVGTWINNAAYLGDGFIFYGDGDGRLFTYLAGALDVVGHELSHGVTDYSSQLDYKDESGALNEAFSDIMGTAIEFFFERSGKGPQKGPNWLIGEDVTRAAPGFIRSLQNPAASGNPDHYSLRQLIGTAVDNGGVHLNSTIASHAFYLAVAGGRNRVSSIAVQGVGLPNMERMERIFFRAFAFLLTPAATFSDARAATLQAATDLYGAASNERAQVAQAWTAVGVQ